MSTQVTTIVKSVVRRDWNDLEPKLIAFLATGLTATGLVQFAAFLGVHPTPAQAALAVLVISSIAGYIKSSSSKDTISGAATDGVVVNAPAPVPVNGGLGLASLLPTDASTPPAVVSAVDPQPVAADPAAPVAPAVPAL